MNGGVLGLLLIGVALGIASVACWRFMAHPAARCGPGLLAAAYYVAMWFWPHAAVLAVRTGHPYPAGDSVRLILLGLALVLAIVELSTRLHRTLRTNAALRRQLEDR
ncbi:hypothetical protein [Deinococcus aquiradiocola]|uniref:Uncharacterized protein n=1 Tax=Deinococcus aquiradiocola TaxID=393059 RepID=A0A917P7S9_9DEIO|nr:hypothetical protein [Deinococcus aquiradiocola]GGJ65445.1 hypothetical protein GCM10008939_06720 [Deinococcus aquiradiocola]